MKLQQIPLAKTHAFSGLFLDYLAQKETLQDFYGYFPIIENFALQIAQKQAFSPSMRQVLVKSLHTQYQHIAHSPAKAIQSLGQSNTFTVTTGHQLSLFTGPLYFIFKIVTAINLAKKLQVQYPDYTFVPVYWMASEDHDFEEINHFHLFGKTFQWLSEQKGAVGRFKTEGIASIFEELSEKIPLFEKAYLEHQSLSKATRFLVNEIFGKYGLICIDGDDCDLKACFKEVIKADILQQHSHRLVTETSQKLIELQYHPQVHPREINFFYLDEQLRERIVRTDEGFAVLNTDWKFSEKDLENILDKHPEKISPNVIMRPVYQEVILPNLAYIGGPGELVYWLQLKAVFAHYQVPFPILFPRNFGMIIPKTHLKKIEKLRISVEELFQTEHALKEQFIRKNSQVEISLADETQHITDTFRSILQKAIQLDKSLEGFVGAEQQKTLKSIENIEKRLKKAEETKLETEIKQLSALKEKLFPANGLQERYDNVLNFWLNEPDFIAQLIALFEPFLFEMNVLLPNE